MSAGRREVLLGPARTSGRRLRWPLRSLISKLILLLVVFVTVPVILYGQFREADAEKQELLLESVRQQGRLMAESLRPILERKDPSPLLVLPELVKRVATPNTDVKVFYRPKDQSGAEGFYFVAAQPEIAPANLEAERDALIKQDVLGNLVSTCAAEPITRRHHTTSGEEELLTSINPIRTETGCWFLITAHTSEAFLGTSIGQSYWQTLEVQIAALIYLGMALVTIGLFVGVWRSLMRFRRVARDIGSGMTPEANFEQQNRVPELTPVAREFDRMTVAMRDSADEIRRAAEDNAHAFKTPIAIMRQSTEPLRRIVPLDNQRGQRALDVLEESVERLDRLVASARHLDEVAAELIDRPRYPVDLSRLVGRMLDAYASSFASRQVRLDARLQSGVVVRGDEELLEVVFENIIDNALSVSPQFGSVTIDLRTAGSHAALAIRDEGPGVPPGQLDKIFERYVSLRPPAVAPALPDGETSGDDGAHLGIGLWIVRRNLEALDGKVWAENRSSKGFELKIDLPLAA